MKESNETSKERKENNYERKNEGLVANTRVKYKTIVTHGCFRHSEKKNNSNYLLVL